MATAKVKAEPGIKPDPDIASPAAMSEDDVYEDAGDLEFWDPAGPESGLWVANIPKYLYDQWAQLDDDEEIRVGTLRSWAVPGKDGSMQRRFQMLIDAQNPAHQEIPKEYRVDLKDPGEGPTLENSFLFTEEDIPALKGKSQVIDRDIPQHLRYKLNPRPKSDAPAQPAGVKKRYQPYYRKAIPKKTRVAGRFAYEINLQPEMTPEALHLITVRATDALKPKSTTSMMTGTIGAPRGVIQAGTSMGNAATSSFVRAEDPKAKAKKQNQERAARMEESVLRDALFQCFREYKYWSMKTLKDKLGQPETWLRENLETIANLHKSGRFANYWEMKDEYRLPDDNAQGIGGNDGDDDENIKMEDVAM